MDGELHAAASFPWVTGIYVHADLHRSCVGADDACVDLDKVSDLDGAVESDPSGVDGNSAVPGEFHGAGGGRFVDPGHGGAAVDFASPVHVLWFCHESGDEFWGSRIFCVALLQHFIFDGFTQIDAG